MRRVVITGMGLVTPLGVGLELVWQRLLAGQSGIRSVSSFDVSDLPTKIAGQVPRGKERGEFDADHSRDVRDWRRLEPFLQYAIVAALEAVRDAGWEHPPTEEAGDRTGVLIGSGVGGLERIAASAVVLHEQGPRRVSPFFIPMSLINEASGLVGIRLGFRGPCHSVVTACATGANAIGDAARLIQYGDADVMVAGGTESATGRLAFAGFSAMRAMSREFNDSPSEASRPWDRQRDGFVLGEGAGIVVLEEREHALRRGARIYCEVLGYGISGDAYHLTAPEPSGAGALRAMRSAVKHAQLDATQLGYVNAHATSTPVGDPVELRALRSLLGEALPQVAISSTKSSVGHLLGAAGAVEAIFTALALRDQTVPATLNLHDPEDADLDLVPRIPKQRRVEYALTNSFGFGGTNASLVLGR